MPRKSRRSIEAAIQTAVMLHIATRGRDDVFAFHVPNGGSRRSVIEGANLKRQGVVAGVPDLCVVIRGFAHFLEIKAPGGTVSPVQRAVALRLRKAGAFTQVAVGLDEALEVLSVWGAFRADTHTSLYDAAARAIAAARVNREMAQ